MSNTKQQSVGFISEVRVTDIASFSLLAPDAGAKPQQEVYSDEISGAVIDWGSGNDWPQKARLKVEKSTTAFPLIKKLASIVFGKGFTYYKEVYEADGTITRDFTRIAEVDTFLMTNDIENFLMERLFDLYLSGNLFCEFILNKSLTKIVNINHLESEFSRFKRVEPDQTLNTVLYSGTWPTPKQTPTELPFCIKANQNKDFIKQKFSGKKKFVTQSYLPSPGRTVYAMPPHGALFRDNGWLDFGNSVPEIMNAINKNAWNIKYHIQIPHDYWQTINKKFDGLDDKQKNAFIDSQISKMNDWLSGNANGGKTFVSHFFRDMNGKEMPGFKIEVLDDKTKKDSYLTSVQESDIQVSRAYGVDSSLSNIQPQGGKMGAGSGSDKRTGFENQVNTSFLDVLVVTEPLRLVAHYNDWPTNLKFGFIHEIPTSLNENKSGSKTEI
jgi:hypothetical protein